MNGHISRLIATSAIVATLVIATAVPVAAAPRLTVSKTGALDPAGEQVLVQGGGFDESRGIYLALCVIPSSPKKQPGPCGGGGVQLDGSNGSSQWISSNPPSYGEGLTVPWGPGGTFSVAIRISPLISPATAGAPAIDCRTTSCAITTRADHLSSGDRSQDVLVPVTFAGPAPTTPPNTSAPSNPSLPTPPSTRAPGADPGALAMPPATDGTRVGSGAISPPGPATSRVSGGSSSTLDQPVIGGVEESAGAEITIPSTLLDESGPGVVTDVSPGAEPGGTDKSKLDSEGKGRTGEALRAKTERPLQDSRSDSPALLVLVVAALSVSAIAGASWWIRRGRPKSVEASESEPLP